MVFFKYYDDVIKINNIPIGFLIYIRRPLGFGSYRFKPTLSLGKSGSD